MIRLNCEVDDYRDLNIPEYAKKKIEELDIPSMDSVYPCPEHHQNTHCTVGREKRHRLHIGGTSRRGFIAVWCNSLELLNENELTLWKVLEIKQIEDELKIRR